jgi:hypothetical protein
MIATVTLCAALTFAAPPVTLSNAVEREAARLAKNPTKPTRQDAAWSRVRSLKPATPILLRTQAVSSRRRYFLSADQTTLHVLDLSSVPLSGDPIDRVLKIAAAQPERLLDTEQETTNGPLEIRSGSVAYKGRVIAPIERLVEIVSRSDVDEIDLMPEGHISAGTAALVGALIAGVAGGTFVATSGASRDFSPAGVGLLVFAPIGAAVGYVAGSLADSSSMKPVAVYRR